ncbi:MAG: ASKHA domain-containing protein, partial [Treponema sp.]|nr:ASKHA domain-containing protein [Treponema sp.]
MPKVTFLPKPQPDGVNREGSPLDSKTVEMPEGASLLEGARLAGVFIETPCGGRGTCQKCRAKITVDGITSDALICQARAGEKPVTVELPEITAGDGQFENFEDPGQYLPKTGEAFLKKINLQIPLPALLDGLSDADRLSKIFIKTVNCKSIDLPLAVLAVLPEKLREANGEIQAYYFVENNIARVVDISPEGAREKAYGIAVDIGTTTVALWLVDLEDKKVLAAHNAYNGQVECGLDVISRINYAKKSLPGLRSRILSTINELITGACKSANVCPDRILSVSMAGNTTMIHLLLGIIPEYIRLAPYTPAVFLPQVYPAAQVGITACENAPVIFAPAVGSYVGGDITSGLLCTSLAIDTDKLSDKLILFIDIGTNGEIVLGNREFIFACACSAGPAFEGGGIKHGIRAREGAIERVVIDDAGKPEIHTIGGAPPTGICGSGIISAVAEFFRKGIIDSAGKFAEKNGEYVLCEGITICESDIDNFIRAKGAIFSACQTLLASVGLSFADVDRFYVAGGFGRFLDLEDARTVGLLPRLGDEKFSFLGNTSVIGAYLTLVSEERRAKEYELAGKITYVDLSNE